MQTYYEAYKELTDATVDAIIAASKQERVGGRRSPEASAAAAIKENLSNMHAFGEEGVYMAEKITVPESWKPAAIAKDEHTFEAMNPEELSQSRAFKELIAAMYHLQEYSPKAEPNLELLRRGFNTLADCVEAEDPYHALHAANLVWMIEKGELFACLDKGRDHIMDLLPEKKDVRDPFEDAACAILGGMMQAFLDEEGKGETPAYHKYGQLITRLGALETEIIKTMSTHGNYSVHDMRALENMMNGDLSQMTRVHLRSARRLMGVEHPGDILGSPRLQEAIKLLVESGYIPIDAAQHDVYGWVEKGIDHFMTDLDQLMAPNENLAFTILYALGHETQKHRQNAERPGQIIDLHVTGDHASVRKPPIHHRVGGAVKSFLGFSGKDGGSGGRGTN